MQHALGIVPVGDVVRLHRLGLHHDAVLEGALRRVLNVPTAHHIGVLRRRKWGESERWVLREGVIEW